MRPSHMRCSRQARAGFAYRIFSDACCSEYIEFKLKGVDAEYPELYENVIITGIGGQKTVDGQQHFYLYDAEIVE